MGEIDGRELIEKERQGVEQTARVVVINSGETFEDAGEFRNKCLQRAKMAEALFQPRITEAHRHHKALVADLAELQRPFEAAAKTIKAKMIAWEEGEKQRRRLEQIRLEAEAKKKAEDQRLALAAELEKAGLTKQAERAVQEPVRVERVVAPPPSVKVDGFSYRSNWKFEIEDEGAIPREYLTPDVEKIGRQVRALRADCKIAGVRVIEEKV